MEKQVIAQESAQRNTTGEKCGLKDIPTLDSFYEHVGFFIDVILEGNNDQLTAVPEYTSSLLAECESSLEEARMEIGHRSFALTVAEQSFLDIARLASEQYAKETSKGNKKYYDILSKPDETVTKSAAVQNAPGSASVNSEETPRSFEVYDIEAGKSVMFDSTGAEHWGPSYSEEEWNGDCCNYSIEECLYRHSKQFWTLISEKTHWEAPSSCGAEATKLNDNQAVDWLLRHDFAPPANVTHLASDMMFKPGPPMPAPEQSNDGGNEKPKWNRDLGELSLDERVIRKVQSGVLPKS